MKKDRMLNSTNLPPYLILKDSELLFKIVFNQQFRCITILSPEGRVLDVNELVLISHQATKKDYLGKLFWDSPTWCHLPEWKDIWIKRLNEASNQQGPVITKDIFHIKDGAIRYTDTSTTAIFEPHNDQLAGYIIETTDITDRCLIENRKQEEKSRLEFILEQCHIGNWELNLVNFTSHRSLRHDQIFGYDSLLLQWTYDMFLDHVVTEDKSDVDEKFQLAINTKSDWNFECRIRRKDGEIRWILASGGHAFDNSGKATLMAGVVQDVTELKQAELNKLHHSAELQSLFMALPDTYFRLKPDGTILDYHANNNGGGLHLHQRNFLDTRIQDILPQEVGELFQHKINEMLRTGNMLAFTYELIIDEKTIHFDARINRISLNGQLICVIRDVTEEFNSLQSLAISENRFRTIFEQATVGVALVNAHTGKFIRINHRFSDMLGYSIEEISNEMTFHEITHPDDLQIDKDNYQKILEGQQRFFTREKRYIHKKGHAIWVEINASPTWDINEQPHSLIVIVQDISERKKAEEKLQLSSRVFSDTHEGIIITDAQRRIVDVNPAFCQITGYSREEVLGKSPSILNSGKQSPMFYSQMWQSVNEHGHWQGEVWNKSKLNELYAELLTISSLKNDHDEVTHYIGVFSDITKSKQQQEQLNLMAHYDVLTKLPNRALFIDRFHQSIAHSIRTGYKLAVCFLDLDNFKPVNDNYGHETGDHLLIEVANRIKASIRSEDTVSRQGGDEFTILLNDIKSMSQYEETINRLHDTLAQPYFIDTHQHNITVSSGVTIYPEDDGDIDTLLRHADQAMYQSKLSGKNCSKLYCPDSDQRIILKHNQLDEIEQALLNNEFQLYYQPKINMVTGVIYGVEALIRWIHPEKGLIPPLDFLPLIDATPLETKIGEWVINEALMHLEEWRQHNVELELSVNISSNHLLSSSFVNDLESSLAQYSPNNAKYLQLEILESSAFGDIRTINRIIQTCQDRFGVSFALDDFGTGYSSLTHLRSLPVNTIKIDQSFVRDILDDPSDYSIIEGVIALTKSFNRHVIAEGVETTNQGLMLIMMGCKQAQGYSIAKPMPASDLVQWINNYIPNKNWLECNNKHRDSKQNSLYIFKMINEQWINRFKIKVLSYPDEEILWPILDHKLCQCGNWINREKQALLFNKECTQRLEQAHKNIHFIANKIQDKYQQGDVESARDSLTELDIAIANMRAVEDSCN